MVGVSVVGVCWLGLVGLRRLACARVVCVVVTEMCVMTGVCGVCVCVCIGVLRAVCAWLVACVALVCVVVRYVLCVVLGRYEVSCRVVSCRIVLGWAGLGVVVMCWVALGCAVMSCVVRCSVGLLLAVVCRGVSSLVVFAHDGPRVAVVGRVWLCVVVVVRVLVVTLSCVAVPGRGWPS